MQAFECHILSCDTWVYITVERRGNKLEYNCFRDEEVRNKSRDYDLSNLTCSSGLRVMTTMKIVKDAHRTCKVTMYYL